MKENNRLIDSKNGIIGLVVGDAMGMPLEFCVREKSKVINKEKICEQKSKKRRKKQLTKNPPVRIMINV